MVFVVRIRCVAPRSGNHPRWRLRLPGLPTEYRTVGRSPDEARSAAIRVYTPIRYAAGHIIHLINSRQWSILGGGACPQLTFQGMAQLFQRGTPLSAAAAVQFMDQI
ncbi:MAG: hypothetical protein ACLT2V_06610 [Escherichia coli]